MTWLYRLQQRLSITRREGIAVLTLTFLFLIGLTVRHIQEQQVPPLSPDSLVAQPVTDSTASTPSAPKEPSPSAENPINVNTASREALKALPGIGPALSKRIQRYRSTRGPFQRATELKKVSGIGPATLATLRPMIRTSPTDSTQ
ncbi:MAG: ComEA family DNA-binding protein [Salinibacter sp.]